MRALTRWMWWSSARRCRGPRSSSVRYDFSSGFKRFYPFTTVLWLMQLTPRYCAKVPLWIWAGLALLAKISVHGVLFKNGATGKQASTFTQSPLNQNVNGGLCDAYSHLWEPSYHWLQSVGYCRFWYTLKSQIAFRFRFTLVQSVVGMQTLNFRPVGTYGHHCPSND